MHKFFVMKVRIFFLSAAFLLFYVHSLSQKPIRGVWITNVASEALRGPAKVKETVDLCKQKGINNLFVVVWNKGKTMYPSEVVKQYIGVEQDPIYGGFDPIRAIVEEGHKQGLKVHAWFEFGFSYDYRDSTGLWMKKYPHWASRDVKGNLLQKNGFFWWNAFHPEVQQFMKELVLEVVKKYEVDGVQGDDRLPAMPAEGGYDSFTRSLYQQQTGKVVPAQFNEPHFLQWKADGLSAFGKDLYKSVKSVRRSCQVSWAPSIYPWSKEQYLQDWPAWVKGKYADFVMPQLYRYSLEAYEKVLQELSTQVKPKDKKKVFPGVLTSLGDGYRVKPDMLQKMIALNRQYGFNGECFFYFETLREAHSIYE